MLKCEYRTLGFKPEHTILASRRKTSGLQFVLQGADGCATTADTESHRAHMHIPYVLHAYRINVMDVGAIASKDPAIACRIRQGTADSIFLAD